MADDRDRESDTGSVESLRPAVVVEDPSLLRIAVIADPVSIIPTELCPNTIFLIPIPIGGDLGLSTGRHWLPQREVPQLPNGR